MPIPHTIHAACKKIWLATAITIALNGCGSFFEDDDPSLVGTYSGCSFMADVTESYTFKSDGTYSHNRDDRYGDGVSSEIGNWSTSEDKITLQIFQYKRSSNELRDTTGWQQTKTFEFSRNGNCITIGYSDKFCKGGSCLN